MNKSIQKHSGFSLVELMVALVLGLLLLAGIFTVYVSTQKTSRTSEGVINAQNDAQLALSFLKEDIARAGWVNNSSIAYSLANPFGDNVANNDGDEGSDTLSVQYEACESITGNNCLSSGLDKLTCTGEEITDGSVITNVYSVTDDGVLQCSSNGQTTPLINNVSNFQVLYGQVTNTGLEYVSANNITDVSRIHSVRFGLVLSSEKNTSDQEISRTIEVLDKTYTPKDKKLHLKYESTVVILNKPMSINTGI